MFSWGDDEHGQLGLARPIGQSGAHATPRFCSYNIVITAISCGYAHAMIKTNNGLIYTMGSNLEGQLGIGDLGVLNKNTPVLIESLIDHKPMQISAGGYHSAVIMKSGEMYTWGNGTEGALGLGVMKNFPSPQKVDFKQVTSNFIKEVSCGMSHTMCLDESGIVYVFGCNQYG